MASTKLVNVARFCDLVRQDVGWTHHGYLSYAQCRSLNTEDQGDFPDSQTDGFLTSSVYNSSDTLDHVFVK